MVGRATTLRIVTTILRVTISRPTGHVAGDVGAVEVEVAGDVQAPLGSTQ